MELIGLQVSDSLYCGSFKGLLPSKYIATLPSVEKGLRFRKREKVDASSMGMQTHRVLTRILLRRCRKVLAANTAAHSATQAGLARDICAPRAGCERGKIGRSTGRLSRPQWKPKSPWQDAVQPRHESSIEEKSTGRRP